MNIKRIIAREGLIILGYIVFIVIAIYININTLPIELECKYSVFTGGHQYRVTTKGYLNTNTSTPDWSDDEIEVFRTIEKQNPNDFKTPVYLKVPDSIPLDLKFVYEGNNSTLVNIKDYGLVFCFLLYPLYLIIRFALWAIRTLKQKE